MHVGTCGISKPRFMGAVYLAMFIIRPFLNPVKWGMYGHAGSHTILDPGYKGVGRGVHNLSLVTCGKMYGLVSPDDISEPYFTGVSCLG